MAPQPRIRRSSINKPPLRKAYSSMEIHCDSDSDDYPKAPPARRITTAKSFPPVTRSDEDSSDSDDESLSDQSDIDESTKTGRTTIAGTILEPEFQPELPQNAQSSLNDMTKQSSQQLIYKDERITSQSVAAEGHGNAADDFDAQTLYSNEACLFVANLHQNFDDLTLKSEVTKAFSHYGTVFVKIKRDRRHMPFAFCQYTDPKDAEKAFNFGRGMEILGRGCRIEKCNGNLIHIMYKKNCRRIQPLEAHNIMSAFGQISTIKDLDAKIQKRLNLPQAILVEYAHFDPRRDIVRSLGPHSPYIVMTHDPKTIRLPSERDPNNPHDFTFMELYDKDRRSAYFGNLPLDTTSMWVERLAATIATVVSVEMKQPKDPNSTCVFAFVEFDRPDAPDEAVSVYNNNIIEGVFLRVERKKSRASTAMAPFIPPRVASLSQPTPPIRPFRHASRSHGEHEGPVHRLASTASLSAPSTHELVPFNPQRSTVPGNATETGHVLVSVPYNQMAPSYGSPQTSLAPVHQSAIASHNQESNRVSLKKSHLQSTAHHGRQRSVHFDLPSSPPRDASSPDMEFHHPQPISRALNSQGDSFADRIAHRAVTYGDINKGRGSERNIARRAISVYKAGPEHIREAHHTLGSFDKRDEQIHQYDSNAGSFLATNGVNSLSGISQSVQDQRQKLVAAQGPPTALAHPPITQGVQQPPYIPVVASQQYPQLYPYPANTMRVDLNANQGAHYMAHPEPQGIVAGQIPQQGTQPQIQTYVTLPTMQYGYPPPVVPPVAPPPMRLIDHRGNVVYAQVVAPPVEPSRTPQPGLVDDGRRT